MLDLFRTNQLTVNIFLLLYAGVLHFSAILWPELNWEVPAHGPLADWVYQWVGSTGRLAEIISVLVVFIQAVILNVFFANNRITRDFTLFPGLFYILIASLLPEFLHLTPLLLANTFYLLAYKELFATYRQPLAASQIFNSGFWIGLASLFYFSFTLFVFWGFVALNIMRAFKLRERFMLLIGMLVPFILTAVYYFYTDRLEEWIQIQFVNNYGWLDFPQIQPNFFIVKALLFGLILLGLLMNFGRYSSRRTIDVQKKISLMYWGLFFGGLSLFIQAGVNLEHLAIIAIPVGMLLSISFVQYSRRWAEAWHLLLVAIALFFQYYSYFLPIGW